MPETPVGVHPPASAALELEGVVQRAVSFERYLDGVEKNRDLWHGLAERARLPEWALEAANALPGDDPLYLVAISADWCGDAVNILPWVARLADASSRITLGIVELDAEPELMDAHLTRGVSRSIPVVLALDARFRETGWWGPRPAELQQWVLGSEPGEGRTLPTDERYAQVRRWYARDRGASILREVLALLETATSP